MKREKVDKRQRFVIDAINMMFYVSGHNQSYAGVIDDKTDWFLRYTMNEEQHAEWKKWFIVEIKKVLKCSNKIAQKEFMWFDLSWGLKIKE